MESTVFQALRVRARGPKETTGRALNPKEEGISRERSGNSLKRKIFIIRMISAILEKGSSGSWACEDGMGEEKGSYDVQNSCCFFGHETVQRLLRDRHPSLLPHSAGAACRQSLGHQGLFSLSPNNRWRSLASTGPLDRYRLFAMTSRRVRLVHVGEAGLSGLRRAMDELESELEAVASADCCAALAAWPPLPRLAALACWRTVAATSAMSRMQPGAAEPLSFFSHGSGGKKVTFLLW